MIFDSLGLSKTIGIIRLSRASGLSVIYWHLYLKLPFCIALFFAVVVCRIQLDSLQGTVKF